MPNDFLLSNSMSYGRPFITKISGCIHDGWLMLRDKENQFSQDYLYHVLTSRDVKDQFAKYASGAVVKNLNTDAVSKVVITLPPLPEQKRIAAILDKADEIRRKREAAIAKLDQLAQSIFVEMFGNPSGKQRWPTHTMQNLCIKITDGTHHSPEIQHEGIPYITAKHLKCNRLDFYQQFSL